MKVILALLLLTALVAVNAYPRFQEEIPNIPIVNGEPWPGVGHNRAAGGESRNAFGKDFEAAGYQWTPALCRMDSDKDGFTNGQELGDPNCTWVKGQPRPSLPDGATPSHPGLATSVPQPASG